MTICQNDKGVWNGLVENNSRTGRGMDNTTSTVYPESNPVNHFSIFFSQQFFQNKNEKNHFYPKLFHVSYV